jgi:hypothetical protein
MNNRLGMIIGVIINLITSFITRLTTGQGTSKKVADIHRMITEIILAPSPNLQAAPLFTPTPKAARRVLEFFTGQINNDHTRRAYMNATRRFAAWCAQRNLDELSGVQPFHVAAFIKDLQAEVSPPTVKQHLAALRMLLDGRYRRRCRRLSVSNDSTQVRRPHEKTHAPARRLPHDPEARESRGHRDEDRQSYLPRYRHHCVS